MLEREIEWMELDWLKARPEEESKPPKEKNKLLKLDLVNSPNAFANINSFSFLHNLFVFTYSGTVFA